MSQPTLDDILEAMAFRCAGGITDNGYKEYAETKQQLTQLIADIIGEDYSFTDDAFPTECERKSLDDRNRLLAMQRHKAATYGIDLSLPRPGTSWC